MRIRSMLLGGAALAAIAVAGFGYGQPGGAWAPCAPGAPCKVLDLQATGVRGLRARALAVDGGARINGEVSASRFILLDGGEVQGGSDVWYLLFDGGSPLVMTVDGGTGTGALNLNSASVINSISTNTLGATNEAVAGFASLMQPWYGPKISRAIALYGNTVIRGSAQSAEGVRAYTSCALSGGYCDLAAGVVAKVAAASSANVDAGINFWAVPPYIHEGAEPKSRMQTWHGFYADDCTAYEGITSGGAVPSSCYGFTAKGAATINQFEGPVWAGISMTDGGASLRLPASSALGWGTPDGGSAVRSGAPVFAEAYIMADADGGSGPYTVTTAGTYIPVHSMTAGLVTGLPFSWLDGGAGAVTDPDTINVGQHGGGTYDCSAAMSIRADNGGAQGATFELHLSVNGTLKHNCHSDSFTPANQSDRAHVALRCLLPLVAGDAVSVLMTSDGNGDAFAIPHLQFVCTRLAR